MLHCVWRGQVPEVINHRRLNGAAWMQGAETRQKRAASMAAAFVLIDGMSAPNYFSLFSLSFFHGFLSRQFCQMRSNIIKINLIGDYNFDLVLWGHSSLSQWLQVQFILLTGNNCVINFAAPRIGFRSLGNRSTEQKAAVGYSGKHKIHSFRSHSDGATRECGN